MEFAWIARQTELLGGLMTPGCREAQEFFFIIWHRQRNPEKSKG
jgi:hypothetical protein